MSCVTQGFVLVLVLLNIFVGDMDSGIHSEFHDETKLSDVLGTLERRDVIQRDVERIERRVV